MLLAAHDFEGEFALPDKSRMEGAFVWLQATPDPMFSQISVGKTMASFTQAGWIFVIFGFQILAGAAGLRVTNLKCEYQTEPLAVETQRPRLSWVLESRDRGQEQTAYQILVATSRDRLAEGKADLWDSGRVVSPESVHVVYAGDNLRPGQEVCWKVRVWDRQNRPSAFSQPARWEMGMPWPDCWRAASWIERPRTVPLSDAQRFEDDPAPLFRKEFVVEKKLRRARLYVSGLGYYEARLNGERVGENVLEPGWTSYGRRVLYSTYDVTSQLHAGRNAIGVMLGNGWFNPLPLRFWGHLNLREHLTVGEPRLILQLVLEYSDGTSITVGSDATWKVAGGPVIRNSIYLGEKYDARLEKQGWDRVGYADETWEEAAVARVPLGELRAQSAPPIRVTGRLKPLALTEPKPGVYVVDLGQNYAGWIRLRVQGPAGTRVRMRYGELLYPDGTLNGMTSVAGQIKAGGPAYRYEGDGVPRTAFQQDEYILKGGAEESYTPRFTFHGFRYVELTGLPKKPSLQSVDGLRLSADVESAGVFECSNPLLNRIQQMVRWTELSNLFSVESDCPHREKFGYGGDIVAASEMAMLNFDMSRFYAKAVDDLADAVRPNGGFTETAPFVGISDEGLGDQAGPVGWGTAHPLLAWQLYQYYGDRRLMEEQYESVRRWVTLLRSKAPDGILDNGISDHESLVPKPRALTGTAFYYLNVRLLEQMAHVLGKGAESAEAARLAESIRSAFNQRFLHPGTGRYDTGTQACQAFALWMGLVPAEERGRALDVLIRDVMETNHGHLTTGIFGTKFMLNALTEEGRADVALAMVDQRTFPGWGYMLERGATTLWEHWEFSDNTFSHNHPMFGSVSEWFYKCVAGISAAPDAVAFDKVIIHPQVVPGLKWVRGSYISMHGNIVSEWRRNGDTLDLHVRIPVGCKARVFLPSKDPEKIREGGKPLRLAAGLRTVSVEGANTVAELSSGDYRFSLKVSFPERQTAPQATP